MNKIIIREAPLEDVIKINATVPEFDPALGKDYFAERIAGKKSLAIVAHLEGRPAGYLVGYDKFEDGSFYCWMAAVDPAYRRQGVLKALMDYQNDWARKEGFNKIKIKTRNNRRSMLGYLVKAGFLFTQVIPWEKTEDNRIELEKNL